MLNKQKTYLFQLTKSTCYCSGLSASEGLLLLLLFVASFPNFMLFHDSLTHCSSRPCRYTSHLTELLFRYEVLFFEVHVGSNGAGGWGYFRAMKHSLPLSQSCLSMSLCCAECPMSGGGGWLRSNFSGSNKLPCTWQDGFRSPSAPPTAEDSLHSRRLLSLLPPKLVFSFLLAYWRKSSLIKCKHI